MQTTKEEEIKQPMQKALSASSNIKSSRFWKGLSYKTKHVQWEGTFDEKLEQISGFECIDIVQNMINSADNDKVITITRSLYIVSEKFELNSNGLNFSDKATHISGIINAESEHGETSVSGIGHACSKTYSNFSPEQIDKDAKTICVESINPQKINSDIYSIIFEPYSVGKVLAFVVAANFGFKIFSEKKSCFQIVMKKEVQLKNLI